MVIQSCIRQQRHGLHSFAVRLETGTDILRQAGLQASSKKNISGSWETLRLWGLGREQITVLPKRHLLCQVVKRYPEQVSFYWECVGNSLERRQLEVHWVTSVLEGTSGRYCTLSGWTGEILGVWLHLDFSCQDFSPEKNVNVFTFYNEETTPLLFP